MAAIAVKYASFYWIATAIDFGRVVMGILADQFTKIYRIYRVKQRMYLYPCPTSADRWKADQHCMTVTSPSEFFLLRASMSLMTNR